MLITSIEFPTSLENTDIENSNIDVFVKDESSYTYIVTVATPKNINFLIDKESMNYFEPGYPFIIVKKLTKDIITEAIEAYVSTDEAYWLKLYHFAGTVDTSVFNKLQAEHIEYLKEFDELAKLDLDELKRLNKLDNS